MSYQVDDLTITKEKDGYVVTDLDTRSFTISLDLEPSIDWFCTYETIKHILVILDADKKLNEVNIVKEK